MKTQIFVLLFLASQVTNAQIFVGPKEAATLNTTGSFSSNEIQQFKNTTTIFTLQNKDYAELEKFKQAIASVWTITPFLIVSPDEVNKYMDGKYSFFTFSGFKTIVRNQSGNSEMIHYIYSLWMPDGKGEKLTEKPFAKIFLSCDFNTYKSVAGLGRQKDFSRKLLYAAYNDAVFYNWTPGFLKGYLKTINDLLMNGESRGPFSGMAEKEELKSLQHDTLFVPDYVNVRFNPLSGAENNNDDNEEGDISYKYPVKIISADKLSDMILDDSHPIKYLVYTRSNTDKYVTVYESATGKMIYTDYTSFSYNFKNKDYKKIADKIGR